VQRWRWCWRELEPRRGITREDAVDDHDMKVDVEVEAAPESLHEGDRTELRRGEPDAQRPPAV